MNTNKLLNDILRDWFEQHRRELDPSNSVHIHVDELMKKLGRTQYHPVFDLLEAYETIIDLLGSNVEKVMPSLLIPLSVPDDPEMSIRNLLSPPDLEHLNAELTREPPSIYLAYRSSHLLPRRGETYVKALNWQPFRVPRDDVFFYYQVDGVRGVPGYDDDRPFFRSVLGKQYPRTLRPGLLSL